MAEVAAWTQEPPTEPGWYWLWNGDRDYSPLVVCVLWSGTSGKCFVSATHPYDQAMDCDRLDAWWLRLAEPELPTE